METVEKPLVSVPGGCASGLFRIMRPSTWAAVLLGAVLLPVEAAWFVGWVMDGRFGMDSAHAYWAVWDHPLYSIAPGHADAFNYSPAVAQALWPATLLPWPVFLTGFSLVLAGALAWLLWPLPRAWRYVLLAIGLPVALVIGNVEVLFAVVAVLGIRHPSLWAFPLLTKVTPGLGPLWFALRGQWRQAIVSAGVTAAVVAVSAAVAPQLWVRWLHFLADSPVPATQGHYPPLWLRGLLALMLLVWGARTDRRWTLAVAVALCVPLWSLGAVFPLAAIPRLRAARVQQGA